MSNKMIKVKYFALQIKVASPICVSGGESENTDSDIMRNGDGEIFIPGTSFAGAFRNYTEQKKDKDSIFGYSKGEEGHMSSVFISDLYFDKGVQISIRDQVQLDRNKQVNNKFDTEILETGAIGNLYFHYIVREKDKSEDEFEKEIASIIKAIQEGYIRIGSNKNRGFGRLEISDVKSRVFTKDNLEELLKFKSDSYKDIEQYNDDLDMKDKLNTTDDFEQSKYIKITAPLKLSGGISIRRYSTEPNKADYEHIKCNQTPVIPGSSWNGAIREMCTRILEDLLNDSDTVEKYMDKWFGYVRPGEKDTKLKATQSMIIFGESILQGGQEKVLSRNKVNRFDGSTIDGALYTEKAYFGGTTALEIMIRKNEPEYKALAGLIELVIEDIKEGYVTVGGQAAIGRGIFEAMEEEDKEYSWQCKDESINYRQELYHFLQSQMCKGGE